MTQQNPNPWSPEAQEAFRADQEAAKTEAESEYETQRTMRQELHVAHVQRELTAADYVAAQARMWDAAANAITTVGMAVLVHGAISAARRVLGRGF